MKEQEIIVEKDQIIKQLLLEKEKQFNKQLDNLNSVISGLKQDLLNKDFQLQELLKIIYGKRSEKRKPPTEIPNQLTIDFDGLTLEQNTDNAITVKEKISYERKKRTKKQPIRQALPKELPRRDIIIEPEGDLSNMVFVSQKITEELEYKPAELFVNRYIVKEYASKTPNKDGSTTFKKGTLPSRPIEKGIPGSNLLANIIVNKYGNHLPIYRQIEMFKRLGVHLSASTLYGWLTQIGKLLEPLYDELEKLVIEMDYLMVDETGIKVLDANKKNNKIHKGYYWVYYCPLVRQTVFVYQKGRSKDIPKDMLEDFRGYLQTDGYPGYDQFEVKENVVLLGCLAHARRRFVKAEGQDCRRSAYVLDQMQILYANEKRYREEDLKADQIKERRQKESGPVLDALGKWLEKEYKKVTPKSLIGEAIRYSLSRWNRFKIYLNDGRLQIDNNLIENTIRPIAVGRKNYLFAGSHDAAQNAAIFYSLIASCKSNNINPTAYFNELLTKVSDCKIKDLVKLLPGNKDMAALIEEKNN